MTCVEFHLPSLYSECDCDVEAEWQLELDAANINELPADPDDESSRVVEVEKEEKKGLLAEDSYASLQGLLNRWQEREKKLQTFHESLDEIGLWTSIGNHVGSTVDQQGGAVCTRTCSTSCFLDFEPVAAEYTVIDAAIPSQNLNSCKNDACNTGIPGKHGILPAECTKSDSVQGECNLDCGLRCNLKEECEGVTFPGTEGTVAELYRERAEVLQEYRIAGIERSRQRELKQQTENEVACKKLALVAKKKKTLQMEQANKLAELERERILEARLFDEEQKRAQDMLQAQDMAMELNSRALHEIVVNIKAREDEMVKSRLAYQVAQDQKFFDEARRHLAGKKILQAFKKRRCHMQCCCIHIQAAFRQYLCRKRLKELEHQTLETLENKLITHPNKTKAFPVQEPFITSISGNVTTEREKPVDSVLPTATAKVQSKILKLRQLFKKALKVGLKTGKSYEPLKTETAMTSVALAKLEVPNGDDYEFDYEGEVIVHSKKEKLILWLKQITDGWEIGRCEAFKMSQEARSIGLIKLASAVESVIFDREKTLTANLESSVVSGSRRAFQYWLAKARRCGLKEVVVKCCKRFEERLEKTKQNLPHQALNGSRQEYMSAFHTADSLGLNFEVEEAAKVVLKRAYDVVKTTMTLTKRVKAGGKSLRTLDPAEKAATRLGIGLKTLEYIRRFSFEASVNHVACISVTIEPEVTWSTVEKLDEELHGSSKPEMGNAKQYDWHLEHWFANSSVPEIVGCKTSLDTWLGSHIWSFNQNWPEIDKLRGAWQQQMMDSRRLFTRTDLQSTAVKALQSGSMSFECGAAPAKCRVTYDHESEAECNLRVRRDNCGGRFQRGTHAKVEAAEDNVIFDVEEEIDDDEKKILELGFQVPASLLVRPDDSFEWERSLCMPLVLTKLILEQKATCSRTDLKRLKKLDMTYDALSSIGEGILGQWCPALRVLVLDRNKLTTLRGGLKGCSEHVEHISAKDNFISDLAGLENLSYLKILHLEGNSLRQVVSTFFGMADKGVPRTAPDQEALGFKKPIREPHISANEDRSLAASLSHYGRCNPAGKDTSQSRVSGRHVRVQDEGGLFPHSSWPSLKELGLSCNKLAKVVGLGRICPRLEVLDLSSNQLVTLGVLEGDALAGLSCLRVLDVGQNKLKGRSLWDALKNCPLLLSLVASRNRLSELPTHPGNVFLREIWLNGNVIRRLACNAWFPNLRRLYLQDNSINYLEPLWGCPALEVLDLSFNNIADLWQLRKLACFPCLKTLQLNDNPVSELPDYVDKVLEAVPWLVELDNEPTSEANKDKAVRTIFLKVMDAVGPRYLKDNLENLLARWVPANCQGSFSHGMPLSMNALLNGLADRETLWAIMCVIMRSSQTSTFLRAQLGIQGDTMQHDVGGQHCPSDVEARWNVFAFQEMAAFHGQRLQTGFRDQTLDNCRVRESGMDMLLGFPNAYSFTNDPSVFPQDASFETGFSKQSRGKYDPEQYLADHINFCPLAYREMLKINSEYSSDMDIQRRRVVKLQALARKFLAKLRFKRLDAERAYDVSRKLEQSKQEAWKKEISVCKVQSLWRGLKVRRDGLLLRLREVALQRVIQGQNATRIQAAWRGCSIRSKFRMALAGCKYVDHDEYDYISVDEVVFTMDDSFLEQSLTTGADVVTYSGVEFLLGKKMRNTLEIDGRVPDRSLDTRREKRWVTASRSSSVPADNGRRNVMLPPSACTVSSCNSPQKCTPRVATAPIRPTIIKTIEDDRLRLTRVSSHGWRKKVKHEVAGGDSRLTPKPSKLSSNRMKKKLEKACTPNPPAGKSLRSESRREQISNALSDDHPYLRRAHEKKKEAVAEIVKDWGFKDEKTAQSFLKAREKAKGHARAKGEAYRALLQDPQQRLNIFKARTEVRASQIVEAAPVTTKRAGISDRFALHTVSCSLETHKALAPQRGCCSVSSETATSAMDRSQCSSKSSIRKPEIHLLEPSLVTASCSTLDLRPVAITPESPPIPHIQTRSKSKIRKWNSRKYGANLR